MKLHKLILKFIGTWKEPIIANTFLKKNKVKKIIKKKKKVGYLSDIKTYYKTSY